MINLATIANKYQSQGVRGHIQTLNINVSSQKCLGILEFSDTSPTYTVGRLLTTKLIELSMLCSILL